MELDNIIGGEFEYQTEDTICSKSSELMPHYTYSSGRAALFHILTYCREYLQCRKIWLPDYLCHSIVEVVRKAQMDFGFYHINDNLQISIAELSDIEERGG